VKLIASQFVNFEPVSEFILSSDTFKVGMKQC